MDNAKATSRIKTSVSLKRLLKVKTVNRVCFAQNRQMRLLIKQIKSFLTGQNPYKMPLKMLHTCLLFLSQRRLRKTLKKMGNGVLIKQDAHFL